jgi:hypothetical protein
MKPILQTAFLIRRSNHKIIDLALEMTKHFAIRTCNPNEQRAESIQTHDDISSNSRRQVDLGL